MKTIEVTDEQYEFLKEAKELLTTQNNRCTRDPIYCIMEKRRIYGFSEDYSSDFVWVRDDTEFKSIDDLFDDVIENYENYYKEYIQCYYGIEELVFIKDEARKHFKEDLEEHGFVFESFLEDKDYHKVYYRDETELSQSANIFSLFEKDVKDYVESKRSDRIFDYVESTWRSNRMSKLIKFLKELNI